MIPRALPKLVTDALANGWDVHVEQASMYRSTYTTIAEFHHGDTGVAFIWSYETGRIVTSEINGTPTPYQQCTRLIRSREGA